MYAAAADGEVAGGKAQGQGKLTCINGDYRESPPTRLAAARRLDLAHTNFALPRLWLLERAKVGAPDAPMVLANKHIEGLGFRA